MTLYLQLVLRPDVVEMHDVTSRDPKLLVHLKVRIAFYLFIDYRNLRNPATSAVLLCT